MEYNDYELIYMVNEDEDALLCLLNKYEPLFRKIAACYVRFSINKGFSYDDIVQQCRVTLYEVIDKYDCDKDVLFYTYLLVCLNRAIWNMLRNKVRQPECCYYMDIEDYDNLEQFRSFTDISFDYDDYEFEVSVINFKNSLKDLDSWIFELRYNEFGYRDIASLLDINIKKVDNSLLRTKKKMEKYFLFS